MTGIRLTHTLRLTVQHLIGRAKRNQSAEVECEKSCNRNEKSSKFMCEQSQFDQNFAGDWKILARGCRQRSLFAYLEAESKSCLCKMKIDRHTFWHACHLSSSSTLLDTCCQLIALLLSFIKVELFPALTIPRILTWHWSSLATKKSSRNACGIDLVGHQFPHSHVV